MIRFESIPQNDVIGFRPISLRLYKCEVILNILKKNKLKEFYENKISLLGLLNLNETKE